MYHGYQSILRGSHSQMRLSVQYRPEIKKCSLWEQPNTLFGEPASCFRTHEIVDPGMTFINESQIRCDNIIHVFIILADTGTIIADVVSYVLAIFFMV
jgi:hypothetical protein